jgi:hypothetical protein
MSSFIRWRAVGTTLLFRTTVDCDYDLQKGKCCSDFLSAAFPANRFFSGAFFFKFYVNDKSRLCGDISDGAANSPKSDLLCFVIVSQILIKIFLCFMIVKALLGHQTLPCQ